MGGRRQKRPLALVLSRRNPVLDRLGLCRLQFDRLPQRLFGVFELARAFEDPPGVLENHEAVADPVRRRVRCSVDELPPLGDSLIDKLAVFERAAEIDMGGAEVGLVRDRPSQHLDRTGKIAGLAERHAVVETGDMNQRVVVIEGNPRLVEVEYLLLPPSLGEGFAHLHEFGQRQLPAPRPIEHALEHCGCIDVAGLRDVHWSCLPLENNDALRPDARGTLPPPCPI